MKKQIKLGISVRWVGYFAGAWRESDVPSDGGMSYDHYENLAKIAERGLFDIFFLADDYGMSIVDNPPGSFGHGYAGADLENYTLCAALSRVTKNIGLAVTSSTTFIHPYHLARLTLSLDHLTQGRAGWNVVTSSLDEEAMNFGFDTIMEKSARYKMARESVEVVKGLWNSWDDDAFVRDKASGVFFDPAKMRLLNHKGAYFQVRGPLNLPRSVQGEPVVIQAGSSVDGIDLASSVADIVYTAQNTMEATKAFIAKVRDGLARHNRRAEDVLIMPGILPIIGGTEDEAQAKYRKMQESIDPMVGLAYLAQKFSGDLTLDNVDKPVAELNLSADFWIQSRGEEMLKLARRNNWTVREMYQSVMIGNAHKVVVGTPAQIVDHMQAWFDAGLADGFNILPYKTPTALTEFVDHVVPELQRRGLFRTSYESTTLRGNLGLPKP